MSEQHGNENKEEEKRQASGSQSESEQKPAHDGAAPGSDRKGADGGWDGVNDGIDRAEADVSQMMDDLEYIRAKVRVLRGRYG